MKIRTVRRNLPIVERWFQFTYVETPLGGGSQVDIFEAECTEEEFDAFADEDSVDVMDREDRIGEIRIDGKYVAAWRRDK